PAVREDHRRIAPHRAELHGAGRGGPGARIRGVEYGPSERIPRTVETPAPRAGGVEGRHMVIVMNGHATEDQIEKVIAALTQEGYDAHRSTGTTRTVIGVVGASQTPLDPREFEILPGVHAVVKITEPYKLAGRSFQPEDTVIRIGDVETGGRDLVMIAG